MNVLSHWVAAGVLALVGFGVGVVVTYIPPLDRDVLQNCVVDAMSSPGKPTVWVAPVKDVDVVLICQAKGTPASTKTPQPRMASY